MKLEIIRVTTGQRRQQAPLALGQEGLKLLHFFYLASSSRFRCCLLLGPPPFTDHSFSKVCTLRFTAFYKENDPLVF